MTARTRQIAAALLVLGGLYGAWLVIAAGGGSNWSAAFLVRSVALIAFVLSVIAGILVARARPGGTTLAVVLAALQLPIIDTGLVRYGLHIGADLSVGISNDLAIWLSGEIGSAFHLVWRPASSQGHVGVNLVAASLLYMLTTRGRRSELPTQGGLVTR